MFLILSSKYLKMIKKKKVLPYTRVSLIAQLVKKFACNARDSGSNSSVRKIPWKRDRPPTPVFGLPLWLSWERIHLQCGNLGLTPGLGRSSGEGNSYPLQYSGLENSMDCIVHGDAKSRQD